MSRNPYPLQWPDGTFRRPAHEREIARFRVTMAEALHDLLRELDLMGAANVVITSDLPTRSDGLPYSSGRAADPGIAVWAVVDGQERVFTCDRWNTAAANLRAIGKTVEAIRGLARWGGGDTVTRALGGFTALPPGDEPTAPATVSVADRDWYDVLGIDVSLWPRPPAPWSKTRLISIIKARYRALIRKAHPDVGGSVQEAAELTTAFERARQEIGF